MQPVAKLYSLTSVTLRGTVMLIPAIDFKSKMYPFDLEIILPKFILQRKSIDPFLKYLHFINFHYAGKLSIASMILVKVNEELDELYRIYLKTWNENTQIAVIPERRRVVEQEIVRWVDSLPKTDLSEFIKQYYSISISNTDWRRKKALWKSLKTRSGRRKETSKLRLEKLREKYVEVWFKFMEKMEFSSTIKTAFPGFINAMNQLTFREIIQDLRICPVCEADLSDYPSTINFCSFCGSNLKSRESELSEPEVRFCANCGNELRPGIRFCNNCGKKIEN